ncbi:MAG: autotransporter outer membrane beta-barrel domain-containing protein, partial [Acidobacteriaceae bacterium]|jgi:outer membrane autotransporter protein|nr:autotransporter outer membrane beta-barrel domain-containing protein [Acidobacteriaceae bacterium]
VTTVTFEQGTAWTGRLGARLSRTWGGTTPLQPRATTWGRASLWKDFMGTNAIRIDATTIGAAMDHAWLDLGGGGDVRLHDPFTLYGTLGYQTAVTGTRHAIASAGGLRLDW